MVDDRALIEAVTEVGVLRAMVVRLSRDVLTLRQEMNEARGRLNRSDEAVDELFAWLREVHDRQEEVPPEVMARARALLPGSDG